MPTLPDRTVGHIVGLWLDDVEGRLDLVDGTKEAYGCIARNLLEWGRDKSLAALDLRDYAITRRDAGKAPRRIALELTIAGVIYRWARRERLIPSTAILRVPRVKVDAGKFVINHMTPTPNEVSLAVEAMDRDDFRLAVLLLARTGARVGEVAALRSCDLDEEHGRLAFGATTGASKTGSGGSRSMPRAAATSPDAALGARSPCSTSKSAPTHGRPSDIA